MAGVWGVERVGIRREVRVLRLYSENGVAQIMKSIFTLGVWTLHGGCLLVLFCRVAMREITYLLRP